MPIALNKNPLALALARFVVERQRAGAGPVLLVGIQAALHAGLVGVGAYHLMILDTPSLLTRPPGFKERGFEAVWIAVREWVGRMVIRRGMRRARSVMATTRYMAEEIRALYGVEAAVVYQGGPAWVQEVRRRLVLGGEIRLLTVNRLETNKRVDWLIRALAAPGFAAGTELGRVVLDVVGEGSDGERLRALAEGLGLAGRVRFRGRLTDEQLGEAFGGAHALLMPARQGYGLPALEGLSVGLPVLIHRESGVSEVVGTSPWVEVCEGGEETLQESLERLCRRLMRGEFVGLPRPTYPTEEGWAAEVAGRCGWLSGLVQGAAKRGE